MGEVGSDERVGTPGRRGTQVGQGFRNVGCCVSRGVVVTLGRVEQGRDVCQGLDTRGELGVGVQAVQVGSTRGGDVAGDHGG